VTIRRAKKIERILWFL